MTDDHAPLEHFAEFTDAELRTLFVDRWAHLIAQNPAQRWLWNDVALVDAVTEECRRRGVPVPQAVLDIRLSEHAVLVGGPADGAERLVYLDNEFHIESTASQPAGRAAYARESPGTYRYVGDPANHTDPAN